MGLELIRVNPDGERVQFRPDAAASFRRMEVQQGRTLDVNRTVVTWDEQNDLYQRRQRGEYPYSVAHPDESNHVYRSDTDGGSAWDTDERGDWLEDNGWIADVPGEPWHRNYHPDRDNRRTDPTPTTTQSEEDDMPNINFRREATGISYTLVPGYGITAHANEHGARLTTYGNTGTWPPVGMNIDQRIASGERQFNDDNLRWWLSLMDLGWVAQDLDGRLPTPGQYRYCDKLQKIEDAARA